MKRQSLLLLMLFAFATTTSGMPTEGEQSPGVSKPLVVNPSGQNILRYGGAEAWIVWLPSATYTVSQSTVFTNHGYSGITVVCIITSAPGVENIAFRIQARDPLGLGTIVNIATSSATTTTGTVIVTIAPGLTGTSSSTSGQVVNGILPANFQLRTNPSGSGNWVYSCSYSWIK